MGYLARTGAPTAAAFAARDLRLGARLLRGGAVLGRALLEIALTTRSRVGAFRSSSPSRRAAGVTDARRSTTGAPASTSRPRTTQSGASSAWSSRRSRVARAGGSGIRRISACHRPRRPCSRSADGVGTKCEVAIEPGDTTRRPGPRKPLRERHRYRASPIFFLDYVAFGALEPAVVEAVVPASRRLRENGCAVSARDGRDAGLTRRRTTTSPDSSSAAWKRAVWVGSSARGGRARGLARPVSTPTAIRSRAASCWSGFGWACRPPPRGRPTVADVLLRVHRSYLPACARCSHGFTRWRPSQAGASGNVNRALSGTRRRMTRTIGPFPTYFGYWPRPDNCPRRIVAVVQHGRRHDSHHGRRRRRCDHRERGRRGSAGLAPRTHYSRLRSGHNHLGDRQ